MTDKAKAYVESLDLDYTATFVPQSQSRHAGNETPSLNWRITIAPKGRPAHSVALTTDYMEGVAHIPHYCSAFSRLEVYDNAIREIVETGKSPLIPHKNGYDACQAGRATPIRKLLPKPKLIDVLWCLVWDASVLEYVIFEDWASEYGMGTDSRKAEQLYRECLAIALKLRQLIDLDAAREAFEDY